MGLDTSVLKEHQRHSLALLALLVQHLKMLIQLFVFPAEREDIVKAVVWQPRQETAHLVTIAQLVAKHRKPTCAQLETSVQLALALLHLARILTKI